MSKNEERLTDALKSVGETVEPGDVPPPPFPDTSRRTAPRPRAMTAVIAASVVMVGGAAAGGYVAFDRTIGKDAAPVAAASSGHEVLVVLCISSSSNPACANRNATVRQKQEIRLRLQRMPQVRNIVYESQLEAYRNFKKRLAKQKVFVTETRPTDLTDSFRVRVTDLAGARAVALMATSLPGVDGTFIAPHPRGA